MKQSKVYIPLKIKLTIVTTILIAFISIFVYYFFPLQFEEQRLKSINERAKSIAEFASSRISTALHENDFEFVAQEIESMVSHDQIRYAIIYKSDTVYYEYNSSTASKVNFNLVNRLSISKEHKILKTNSHIMRQDENIGQIYFGFSLDTVYREMDELRENVGKISLILFIIGAILSYLIGRIFTKPLSRIVDVVHKITDGDLAQKIEVKSNDEVGFLASSINTMVEKISATSEEMDVIHKELESRVSDRTLELEGALKSLQKENLQRKRVEMGINKSLHEKEVLLKEIHHRVKNNLQIVSSLFFFQSKQITDPKTLEMFRDGQNRVKTMALIHEKLYQAGDLANIDFKEYIKKLTNFLLQSYGINHSKIKLRNNVQDVKLGVDTAVPCGLIINELISNSLKHGFVDMDQGEIKIDMGYVDANKLMLKISDNGKGIPYDFKYEESDSLGLRLVYNLTSQINGNVEFLNNNGTVVKLVFPDPKAK